MKKSELRAMIREMLQEELAKSTHLNEAVATAAPEDSLLATHIAANPEFEEACMNGDGAKIMSIVNFEMEDNEMFTPGAEKLRADIQRMTKGKDKIPVIVGQNILFFVWNSQLAGTGHAVLQV